VELHSAPTVPFFVHSVAPGDGQEIAPHPPWGQLTLHAQELVQPTSWHAWAAVQLTVHAPVEQVTSVHAPIVLQLKVQGTVVPHRRLSHAFIVEQVTVHDLAIALHMVPLHTLLPEHWMSHA